MKFFISYRIFTPKIITNNLSHVLTSWLYMKKVCDMHTLCIPRHNFQKKFKKKIFFFDFLKFFISDRIYTPKIMTNNLSHVLTSWLYMKKVCDMYTLGVPAYTKRTVCRNTHCMYDNKIACTQRPPPIDARMYIMCTYLSIRHSDNQTYYTRYLLNLSDR